MEVNCPYCARPVQTSHNARTGPAQNVRCQWCSSYFTLQHGVPMTTAEFRKVRTPQPPPAADDSEVWEVDADEAFGTSPPPSSSILDDFDDIAIDGKPSPPPQNFSAPRGDFDIEALLPRQAPVRHSSSPSSDEHLMDTPDALPEASPLVEPNIPDLPPSTAPLEAFVDRLEQNWMHAEDFSHLPDLPEIENMHFADAPTQVPPPSMAPNTPPPPLLEPLNDLYNAPMAPAEPGVDDLLAGLLQEDSAEDFVLRFYIRRNDKDFGPFTETEVMSLLENRKLFGNELSRLQHEDKWVPLQDRDDFRPTIEVLKKQGTRVGWDGKAPPSRENLPALEEFPHDDIEEFDVSPLPPEYAPHDFDKIAPDDRTRRVSRSSQHPEERKAPKEPTSFVPMASSAITPPNKPSKGFLDIITDLRFLGGFAVVLLLLVAVAWGLKTKKPTPTTITSNKNKFHIYQLIMQDTFALHRILLDRLLGSHRKGKPVPLWWRVQYTYAMLDSHGEDRTIRTDIEPLYEALSKRKKDSPQMQRLRLVRALSLHDQAQIREAFQQLTTPLRTENPEWGYILARTHEQLGELEKADALYHTLNKKFPQHIRVLLGLFRTKMAQKKEREAARYLWRASRQAPQHLPTQLLAFQYATRTGRWESHVQTLQINIRRLLKKRHYTQANLARWYSILARQHWQHRRTEKAIHRIEQASTLAPEQIDYTIQKLQYMLWTGQTFQALQIAKQYKEKHPKHPEILIWYFKLLRLNDQLDKVSDQLNALQAQMTTPTERYLLFFLLGDYYEHKDRQLDAVESYQKAQDLKGANPARPYASFALIRIYIERKKWKLVQKELELLQKEGQFQRETLGLKGQFLLAQNKLDEALETARALRKQAHTHFSGYLLTAQVYQRKQELSKALAALRSALFYHPVRPSPIHLQMADIYLKQKLPERSLRSIKQYEKLLQGEPSCDFLQRKATVLLKLQQCTVIATLDIKRCRSLPMYLAKGQCIQKLGQTQDALRIFKKMRLLFPEATEPMQALADLYRNEDNYEASTKLYQILLQKIPAHSANLFALTDLYLQKHLYSQAQRLLQQYGSYHQKEFPYHMRVIRTSIALKRYPQALRTISKLRKKAQSNEHKGLLERAMASLFSHKKQFAQALRHIQRARRWLPSDPDILLDSAQLLHQMNRNSACSRAAQQFLAATAQVASHPRRQEAKNLRTLCQRSTSNP